MDSSSCSLGFQEKSLQQQGYVAYSAAELRQLEWGLRFTPMACALLTFTGLMLGNAYLLFFVAFLGIWAFLFPAGHPMDWLYNHLFRHFHGGVRLPPNPLQRRLACFSAAMLNTFAATMFLFDHPVVAWSVGVVLLFLQAIVISTHFCVLSWMYEGFMRLIGRWNAPIEVSQARHLLGKGALVVDVRSVNEYAAQHIPEAINWPSEWIAQGQSLPEICVGKPLLLHCQSSSRSQQATTILHQKGIEAYNLGSYKRALQILKAVDPSIQQGVPSVS